MPAKDNAIISITVEIFVQPLVAKSLVRPGELCLIVFHDGIQAVIDTSDHLIFPEPDASEPAKVLRSSRYSH